jgi:hypothetical protein
MIMRWGGFLADSDDEDDEVVNEKGSQRLLEGENYSFFA